MLEGGTVRNAYAGLSNRMASFSNMMPNPEFHLLGRGPRAAKS